MINKVTYYLHFDHPNGNIRKMMSSLIKKLLPNLKM